MAAMLLVRDIMVTRLTVIPESATIREAAAILHRGRFSGAPVVKADGSLVGVLSEKDLFRAMFPTYGQFYLQEELIPKMDAAGMEEWLRDAGGKPIRELLKPPITTTPDAPLVQVGAIMIARGIHRLPVVEEGRLVGLISRRELYRALFERLFGFTR